MNIECQPTTSNWEILQSEKDKLEAEQAKVISSYERIGVAIVSESNAFPFRQVLLRKARRELIYSGQNPSGLKELANSREKLTFKLTEEVKDSLAIKTLPRLDEHRKRISQEISRIEEFFRAKEEAPNLKESVASGLITEGELCLSTENLEKDVASYLKEKGKLPQAEIKKEEQIESTQVKPVTEQPLSIEEAEAPAQYEILNNFMVSRGSVTVEDVARYLFPDIIQKDTARAKENAKATMSYLKGKLIKEGKTIRSKPQKEGGTKKSPYTPYIYWIESINDTTQEKAAQAKETEHLKESPHKLTNEESVVFAELVSRLDGVNVFNPGKNAFKDQPYFVVTLSEETKEKCQELIDQEPINIDKNDPEWEKKLQTIREAVVDKFKLICGGGKAGKEALDCQTPQVQELFTILYTTFYDTFKGAFCEFLLSNFDCAVEVDGTEVVGPANRFWVSTVSLKLQPSK